MKKIFLLAAVLLSAVSCFFPNDLDYPLIKGEFLSLEVEGARRRTSRFATCHYTARRPYIP